MEKSVKRMIDVDIMMQRTVVVNVSIGFWAVTLGSLLAKTVGGS